jgi:hypothetical protein
LTASPDHADGPPEEYHHEFPLLGEDEVTIYVRYGGRTALGYYDGGWVLRPGDERYDEFLPRARANPTRMPTPQPRDEPDITDEEIDELIADFGG